MPNYVNLALNFLTGHSAEFVNNKKANFENLRLLMIQKFFNLQNSDWNWQHHYQWKRMSTTSCWQY